jgi:hypothetical protein
MLLQSLLRPVLTPIMRGIFDPAQSVSAAWSPLSLWPDGILSPGMWISPRDLTSQWQDSAGTTPVATPGTVADSANPVGLALDIRAGATVLTDPGNHMLQSTSAARPLMSARVNQLTYTEDFSNGVWLTLVYGSGTVAITPNYSLAPDGTTTACRLLATASGGPDGGTLLVSGIVGNGTPYTRSVYIKSNTGIAQTISICAGIGAEGLITVPSSGWVRFDVASSAYSYTWNLGLYRPEGTDAICDISIWHPQLEPGSAATDYQSVLGNGYPYTSTGFPIAQKHDGVDDGMATAAFAAGTLINGMDCMIPVRRDSAAACVAGLYNGIADATKFFGMAESASGSGCVGSGAGTPTVWVDNAQLTGGTAVTRGTLHTALTVGDYHILEFRGLDLSTWTAAGFGLYTSYVFPGARGDILLYPSTASTEDKDAARQWLADYYGVTLP